LILGREEQGKKNKRRAGEAKDHVSCMPRSNEKKWKQNRPARSGGKRKREKRLP